MFSALAVADIVGFVGLTLAVLFGIIVDFAASVRVFNRSSRVSGLLESDPDIWFTDHLKCYNLYIRVSEKSVFQYGLLGIFS